MANPLSHVGSQAKNPLGLISTHFYYSPDETHSYLVLLTHLCETLMVRELFLISLMGHLDMRKEEHWIWAIPSTTEISNEDAAIDPRPYRQTFTPAGVEAILEALPPMLLALKTLEFCRELKQKGGSHE